MLFAWIKSDDDIVLTIYVVWSKNLLLFSLSLSLCLCIYIYKKVFKLKIYYLSQFWAAIATNCKVLTHSMNVSYEVGHEQVNNVLF
jgi:hypothetical protein